MNTFGPFSGVWTVHRASMVELLTGFDRSGRPVTIVALSPEAGADPRWCAEFADLVARDGTAVGPMDSTIHESDLYGPRPWAASYPEPGRRGAERLLTYLPGAVPEGTDPSALLPTSGVISAMQAGPSVADGPFAPQTSGAPYPQQYQQQPPSTPRYATPPPPSKSGGKGGLVVALLAVGLAVVFLLGCGGFGIYKAMSSDEKKPVADQTSSATPTPTEDNTAATPTPDATPSSEPTLKSGPAVSVVGPVWNAGDRTYTMAFRGSPFAFRAPGNFGCLKASNPPPGGSAWVCVAESAGPKGRIAVIYRPCPTTCSRAEQAKLDQDWLDAPVQYKPKDSATRYHEKTAAGKYELTFSHYFGDTPGGAMKYQVAAFASSTTADAPVMQKTINDIRTETP
jgi:hypothetical protein